jgi:DNA-binding response OmpR family regulator
MPGSVVTRQEIVDRHWGKDVLLDTEHGVNTAIRKVRQTLKDDPDNPRCIVGSRVQFRVGCRKRDRPKQFYRSGRR